MQRRDSVGIGGFRFQHGRTHVAAEQELDHLEAKRRDTAWTITTLLSLGKPVHVILQLMFSAPKALTSRLLGDGGRSNKMCTFRDGTIVERNEGQRGQAWMWYLNCVLILWIYKFKILSGNWMEDNEPASHTNTRRRRIKKHTKMWHSNNRAFCCCGF